MKFIQFKCGNCGSKFEINIQSYLQRSKNLENESDITCPSCLNKLPINIFYFLNELSLSDDFKGENSWEIGTYLKDECT